MYYFIGCLQQACVEGYVCTLQWELLGAAVREFHHLCQAELSLVMYIYGSLEQEWLDPLFVLDVVYRGTVHSYVI